MEAVNSPTELSEQSSFLGGEAQLKGLEASVPECEGSSLQSEMWERAPPCPPGTTALEMRENVSNFLEPSKSLISGGDHDSEDYRDLAKE